MRVVGLMLKSLRLLLRHQQQLHVRLVPDTGGAPNA
jgi:hypothetical protein